jgi:hypothetical protein
MFRYWYASTAKSHTAYSSLEAAPGKRARAVGFLNLLSVSYRAPSNRRTVPPGILAHTPEFPV